MRDTVKSLIFFGLGLFLYSRILNGTLFYYISQRFALLTLLAAVGLILVGSSYYYARPKREREPDSEQDHAGHSHPHHHRLSWLGLGLVVLPLVLGLAIRPKPLGSSALSNREFTVGSLASVAAASSNLDLNTGPRNIMDWLWAFQRTPDPAAFNGQEAQVIGFVYRDDRFPEGTFMTGRFTISCCVADAAPIGLVVRSPQADSLPADQWVEVKGHFEAGTFNGQPMPILVADSITETAVPDQPYLYQ